MDKQTYRDLAAGEQRRERDARALHWRTTVVLGYNNIPLRPTADGFDAGSILGGCDACATSLNRLILGGVKVIVWSPGIPFWNASWHALGGRAKVEFHKQQFEVMNGLGKRTDGLLQVARSAADIRRINAGGGIAILLHLSGVCHLNDMGILREYYDLGVRMAHCAFQDAAEDAGDRDIVQYGVVPHLRVHYGGALDEHGARTIEEMKRLGIIVDVAHLLPEGFDDVVSRLDGLPFVYSHGGCAALHENERTFDDRRIAKVAEHGGVYGIGVVLGPNLADDLNGNEENRRQLACLSRDRTQREEEVNAAAKDVRDYIRLRIGEWNEWEVRQLARRRAHVVKHSLSAVVAHMQHLHETFGPQVVGYGPDYEHTYQYYRGLEEADKTPNLTRALLDTGWSEPDVQGALGHNFMRVFDAVLR